MDVEVRSSAENKAKLDKNVNLMSKVPLEHVVYQKMKNIVPMLDDRLPSNLYQTVISSVERPLIRSVLEYTHGNQCKAAQMLGINRNTLRKKISLLRIECKGTGELR